jgi:hypothetical protein
LPYAPRYRAEKKRFWCCRCSGYWKDHTMADIDLLDKETPRLDGLDVALLGFANVWDEDGSITERAVYSGDRIVDALMENEGLDHSSAAEYIAYNIEGAYIGKATPIIVWGDL